MYRKGSPETKYWIGPHVVHRGICNPYAPVGGIESSKCDASYVDQNYMDIIPYGWMTWILENKIKSNGGVCCILAFEPGRLLWDGLLLSSPKAIPARSGRQHPIEVKHVQHYVLFSIHVLYAMQEITLHIWVRLCWILGCIKKNRKKQGADSKKSINRPEARQTQPLPLLLYSGSRASSLFTNTNQDANTQITGTLLATRYGLAN